ncbi:MAG: hypothetical protein ACLQVW_12145, partial [Limisphaerales bacterium]
TFALCHAGTLKNFPQDVPQKVLKPLTRNELPGRKGAPYQSVHPRRFPGDRGRLDRFRLASRRRSLPLIGFSSVMSIILQFAIKSLHSIGSLIEMSVHEFP